MNDYTVGKVVLAWGISPLNMLDRQNERIATFLNS